MKLDERELMTGRVRGSMSYIVLAYSEAQQTGFIKKRHLLTQVTNGQWLIQCLERRPQDSCSHLFGPPAFLPGFPRRLTQHRSQKPNGSSTLMTS